MDDDEAVATEPSSNPVEILRRWEDFGGSWRVVADAGPALTISLCRCDGGEEVDRLQSDDPVLAAFVGARRTSAG
jgi:hypothetical protein